MSPRNPITRNPIAPSSKGTLLSDKKKSSQIMQQTPGRSIANSSALDSNNINFFMCKIQTDEQDPNMRNSEPQFHFHEYLGRRPLKIFCGGQQIGVDEKLGPKFSLIELSIEAANCKLTGDRYRFSRIRPVLEKVR